MKNLTGEWPTWLICVGCGAAFVCGLFVSWAVFSEPARASQPDVVAVDQSELIDRITKLEAAIETLKASKTLAVSTVQSGSVKSEVITARMIGVTDEKGRERITLGSLNGPPVIRMRRDDDTTALTIVEGGGEVGLCLYDTTDKLRLEMTCQPNGSAIVRMFDPKGKIRCGMVSTPEGDAEFIRIDKFGNQKVVQ